MIFHFGKQVVSQAIKQLPYSPMILLLGVCPKK